MLQFRPTTDEEEHHKYQTLFEDHSEGHGIIVDPQSFLRTWIERAEVPFSDLYFEKAQSHHSVMLG